MPDARLTSPRRSALRVALATAILAVVAPLPTAGAGGAAATSLPMPPSVTATPLPGAVELAWTSSEDAHRWKVLIFSDDRYIGTRTFPGTARQGRIDHIPPGTSVWTWTVAVDPDGAWGPGTISPAVRVPRDPSCPATSGTCVHVNARATTGPATGVGLGLLHGVSEATDPARIAALSPRHWRLSAFNVETFEVAEASGASTTLVLSDPWSWATWRPDGRVASPWADDFGYYSWWVGVLVEWHVQMGLVPDRWEIQNEPSLLAFDPSHPPTSALIAKQHAVAAKAIRSVIPDAEIVGPAVASFLFGHGVEDVEAFTQQAGELDFGLGALVWHEVAGVCTICDGGPAAVRQHLDDARTALEAADLGDLPIDITEYGATYEQLQPGAIVGYLSALADGGVRHGGTSCWVRPNAGTGGDTDTCFGTEGTLDGLLLPDGTTPTDAWWTYAAYAKLASGRANLAPTSVDDPTTSAVASATGTTARVLVGRHTGCTAADGPCPDGSTPGASERVTVRMTFPSAARWDVVVSRIASSSGEAGAPTVLLRSPMNAGSTPLTLGSFTVADGEVLQVEATRR